MVTRDLPSWEVTAGLQLGYSPAKLTRFGAQGSSYVPSNCIYQPVVIKTTLLKDLRNLHRVEKYSH